MPTNKCPKCGGTIDRVSVNKHSKQRIGHCSKCGKLVNLGKAETKEAGAAAPRKAASKEPVEKQAIAPARSSSKRADSGAGKRGRPIQPDSGVPKRRGGGIGQFIREFFELD